jgi:hypothetical protein
MGSCFARVSDACARTFCIACRAHLGRWLDLPPHTTCHRRPTTLTVAALQHLTTFTPHNSHPNSHATPHASHISHLTRDIAHPATYTPPHIPQLLPYPASCTPPNGRPHVMPSTCYFRHERCHPTVARPTLSTTPQSSQPCGPTPPPSLTMPFLCKQRVTV